MEVCLKNNSTVKLKRNLFITNSSNKIKKVDEIHEDCESSFSHTRKFDDFKRSNKRKKEDMSAVEIKKGKMKINYEKKDIAGTSNINESKIKMENDEIIILKIINTKKNVIYEQEKDVDRSNINELSKKKKDNDILTSKLKKKRKNENDEEKIDDNNSEVLEIQRIGKNTNNKEEKTVHESGRNELNQKEKDNEMLTLKLKKRRKCNNDEDKIEDNNREVLKIKRIEKNTNNKETKTADESGINELNKRRKDYEKLTLKLKKKGKSNNDEEKIEGNKSEVLEIKRIEKNTNNKEEKTVHESGRNELNQKKKDSEMLTLKLKKRRQCNNDEDKIEDNNREVLEIKRIEKNTNNKENKTAYVSGINESSKRKKDNEISTLKLKKRKMNNNDEEHCKANNSEVLATERIERNVNNKKEKININSSSVNESSNENYNKKILVLEVDRTKKNLNHEKDKTVSEKIISTESLIPSAVPSELDLLTTSTPITSKQTDRQIKQTNLLLKIEVKKHQKQVERIKKLNDGASSLSKTTLKPPSIISNKENTANTKIRKENCVDNNAEHSVASEHGKNSNDQSIEHRSQPSNKSSESKEKSDSYVVSKVKNKNDNNLDENESKKKDHSIECTNQPTDKISEGKGKVNSYVIPKVKNKDDNNFDKDADKSIHHSIIKQNKDNLNNSRTKKKVTFQSTFQSSKETNINDKTLSESIVNKNIVTFEKNNINKNTWFENKVNKKYTLITKRKDFLLEIFKWNPHWLTDFRNKRYMNPPVIDYNKLCPMLTSYDSYDDYYATFKPVMLLEIWHTLLNDYLKSKDNESFWNCSILSCSTQEEALSETKLQYSKLSTEILINKSDFENKNYPDCGDLVILHIHSNGKPYSVFGYIVDAQKTILVSKTMLYNNELKQHVKNPYMLVTYGIDTKFLSDSFFPDLNSVERMETIIYLRSVLKKTQAIQCLPSSPLFNFILKPQFNNTHLANEPISVNTDLLTKDVLNENQMKAVMKAKAISTQKEPSICLIKGPPGTGKTKVIVNIVSEIYTVGIKENNASKILLCAPSNTAVDELVLRLLEIRSKLPQEQKFRLVRTGRDEAMHPKAREVSVTTFAKHEAKKQWLKRHPQVGNINIENMIMIKDKEYRKTLAEKENFILSKANIVACTLNSCYSNLMETVFQNQSIPVCIVDEATQCCELETLIPLMLGVRSLILVGDSNQLPATIISQRAKDIGLDQSLFSRMEDAFEKLPVNSAITLTTQYRMVAPILKWPNFYFYSNQLTTSIKNGLKLPIRSYVIFDLEDAKQDYKRFSNTKEAMFVINLIQTIMSSVNIDRQLCIGVITPYNEQKTAIFNAYKKVQMFDTYNKFVIDVNTIDGFQGQERDIIIMSCVRSDNIGFLSDRQRLCVALTRAKYCLYLCGNFKTFRKNPMWNELLIDAESREVITKTKSNWSKSTIKKNIVR